MRNDGDMCGRGANGHARRGVRHPRRSDHVWLVTRPAPLSGAPARHVTGALALDSAPQAPLADTIRRCVVVIERDAPLAIALTDALKRAVGRDMPVRLAQRAVSGGPSDTPGITVIDASAESEDDASAQPGAGPNGALVVYVTRDTSYALAQRGASSGIVLREWRSVDDIVALLAATLGA